jgi:hypothetical protein
MSLVLFSDLSSGDGVLHGTEGYLSPTRIYHSEARKARAHARLL